MKDLNALRYERGKLITAMREITDKAGTEYKIGRRSANRLTAEEDRQFSELDKQQDKLGKEIAEGERELRSESLIQIHPEGAPLATRRRPVDLEDGSLRAAFSRYLLDGAHGLSPAEFRALQADSDTGGGFLVTPLQMANDLVQDLQNETYALRPGLCRQITVERAESLGVPALGTGMGDATWTAEILTGAEDTSMDFGKRELSPKPIARRIKVSNKLIRSSSIDVEAIVRQQMAYAISVPIETAFMAGTGANQPLGLFTASDLGISTARDVSTGNTATTIGADNLFEMVYSLKPQYLSRSSTRWIFHRSALKKIRQLKDGNGQYLWQPGLVAGQPDAILGIPVISSEYAPSTFTTGLYVGLLGDLSCYWWAIALNFQVQVLFELYSESNQRGYICRAELDGMPTLSEAFVRSKLST